MSKCKHCGCEISDGDICRECHDLIRTGKQLAKDQLSLMGSRVRATFSGHTKSDVEGQIHIKNKYDFYIDNDEIVECSIDRAGRLLGGFFPAGEIVFENRNVIIDVFCGIKDAVRLVFRNCKISFGSRGCIASISEEAELLFDSCTVVCEKSTRRKNGDDHIVRGLFKSLSTRKSEFRGNGVRKFMSIDSSLSCLASVNLEETKVLNFGGVDPQVVSADYEIRNVGIFEVVGNVKMLMVLFDHCSADGQVVNVHSDWNGIKSTLSMRASVFRKCYSTGSFLTGQHVVLDHLRFVSCVVDRGSPSRTAFVLADSIEIYDTLFHGIDCWGYILDVGDLDRVQGDLLTIRQCRSSKWFGKTFHGHFKIDIDEKTPLAKDWSYSSELRESAGLDEIFAGAVKVDSRHYRLEKRFVLRSAVLKDVTIDFAGGGTLVLKEPVSEIVNCRLNALEPFVQQPDEGEMNPEMVVSAQSVTKVTLRNCTVNGGGFREAVRARGESLIQACRFTSLRGQRSSILCCCAGASSRDDTGMLKISDCFFKDCQSVYSLAWAANLMLANCQVVCCNGESSLFAWYGTRCEVTIENTRFRKCKAKTLLNPYGSKDEPYLGLGFRKCSLSNVDVESYTTALRVSSGYVDGIDENFIMGE